MGDYQTRPHFHIQEDNVMPVSEILICFDTEDFTSSRSADAIRDTARLLTEEGVRANYNLVGLLAQQLP